MYIAVDDTDSRKGMCTTYLLTEIIRRSGLDIIGYPTLVRLNPAIEFKTRGNGALSVNLGVGYGESYSLGKFGKSEVKGFRQGEDVRNAADLIKLASEIVEELAELDDPNTNPGIVASREPFPESFYWKAVKEEVSIRDAEAFIREHKGEFLKVKNGRGIIGAAAAISWPGVHRTFELLSYRYPVGAVIDRTAKLKIAEDWESVKSTFNNIDRANRYAAIFPKERTPVVMGIRSLDGEAVLSRFSQIMESTGVVLDRYISFSTNQGTDDHIIFNPDQLIENQSYCVSGEVTAKPRVIQGSHYFTSMRFNSGVIDIAAFEPTKEFRNVFKMLLPGDKIRVYGTMREGCISLEKMEVLNLSESYLRVNPHCSSCDRNMESKGFGDYRCTSCGSRSTLPAYFRQERTLRPGKYDVPVIARRHLSRPFDLNLSETCEPVGVTA